MKCRENCKNENFLFISDLVDPSPIDVVHLTLAVHSVLSLLLVHRGPQVQPARSIYKLYRNTKLIYSILNSSCMTCVINVLPTFEEKNV
jgi:hypothetical protein